MTDPISAIQTHKAQKRLNFTGKVERSQEYRELGYNADSGKSVLEGRDGGIVDSEPITNGYRAPGQPVTVQQSGNVAQSNSMPRPKTTESQATTSKGVKPVKMLFQQFTNGQVKYFVGGHQEKPIEVGKDGLRPIVIENHGGNKFALIGYKDESPLDITIQFWNGNRITSENTIVQGYWVGRDYQTSRINAGAISLEPTNVTVNDQSGVQRTETLAIAAVSNGKVTSKFGAQASADAGANLAANRPPRQHYYTDTLRTVVGSGSYVDYRAPGGVVSSPKPFLRDLRANGQLAVLPDRFFPYTVNDAASGQYYSAPGGGLIDEGTASAYSDTTIGVIADFNLNSALCVKMVNQFSASFGLGYSNSTQSISSNLLLASSGGGENFVNADIRSFDFFPASPIEQLTDTGKGTKIVSVNRAFPGAPSLFGSEYSLHFLNFAILQSDKLTIVDPIKDELNVWTLSGEPSKTTKKADYYPLPKNAVILGAQWHQ